MTLPVSAPSGVLTRITELPLDRRLYLSALAVGVLLRIYVGLTAEGYYFPDEIFQYIEPGHLLAFGRGTLCWEYELGMRSWVLPAVIGGMMRTFDLLGLHHSDDYWRILRLLAALLSCLTIVATDRIGRRLGGAWVGATAALLVAVYVPLLNLAPRVLVDTISGTLTVWALARIITPDASNASYRWAGGVFAIATVLRLASGVAIVPPFFYLAFKRDWRRLIAFTVPIALIFVASGAIDWATWGHPFHSWLTYVQMNFVRGVSAEFGTAPNDAYLNLLLRTFDWLYPAALACIVIGFRNSGLAGATMLLTFLFMSAADHKEFRFTAGILPIMLVLLVNGMFAMAEKITQARLRRVALAGVVAVFAMQNLNEVGDEEWGEGVIEQRAMAFVQRMPDIHAVFFAGGRWFAGGETMMHRNIPMYAIANTQSHEHDYAIAVQNTGIDIIVADDTGLAGLVRAGLATSEIRAVHSEGPWTIYRRSPPTP